MDLQTKAEAGTESLSLCHKLGGLSEASPRVEACLGAGGGSWEGQSGVHWCPKS